MNEQSVPVFWDNGYWYVVPSAADAQGNRRPSAYPEHWCATYGVVGGVSYALLRTPTAWMQAPAVPVTQQDVLDAAKVDGFHPASLDTKPVMRVGGL